MKVVVAVEHRFRRLPDGSVWTQTQFAHTFWRRYLEVFDRVCCVARVLDVAQLEGEWHRADGAHVSFAAVPYYVGLGQFLMRATGVRRAVDAALIPGDAFVLRVPGNVSRLVWNRLLASGYPYGVEVLGDPYFAFAPGAVAHPLRAFFRWYWRRELRLQCAGASASSYVTQHALQRLYPSSCPSVAASSIELPDDVLVRSPRSFAPASRPLKLLFVGSLEQYYKAPDVLIESFARCLGQGLNLHLTIVGDGKHRPALEALATARGCGDRIRFAGQLAGGAQVYAELDKADVFVLPSRSEGLPRAMVEAMARGLPCIGSDAGGIPELLMPDAIVRAGDIEALATKIAEVVQDPVRMRAMSECNLARVAAYRSVVLQQQRLRFYRVLHDATVRWIQENPARGRPAAPEAAVHGTSSP